MSLGNFLGGKIADFVKNEKQASWLFLAASILTLSVLVLETPAQVAADPVLAARPSRCSARRSRCPSSAGPVSISLTWPFRILFVVTRSSSSRRVTMGTVSPVVAKLAVDRLKRYKRTGTAIGQVYAWGMVGSILGTFLTGFFLIECSGPRG